MAFKGRPVLIIWQADAGDYVALPISRVTKRENLDEHFDYEIKPEDYVESALQLSEVSFIRTHKQAVLNAGDITKEVLDLKTEFPDVFTQVLDLVEEFQKKMISDARK